MSLTHFQIEVLWRKWTSHSFQTFSLIYPVKHIMLSNARKKLPFITFNAPTTTVSVNLSNGCNFVNQNKIFRNIKKSQTKIGQKPFKRWHILLRSEFLPKETNRPLIGLIFARLNSAISRIFAIFAKLKLAKTREIADFRN